ncbi:MAG TPA: helix-turn-helix transcriptional regulator [Thermomicrobiales bacterium]|nr:helix-turn-helix transcriptional regulator [Thermomicrobiales bacterium]
MPPAAVGAKPAAETGEGRERESRLRRDAAPSQEELAERAGLSARGISDLERDGTNAASLSERALYERPIAAARQRLGGDAFTRAWAAGQARPTNEAIDDALDATPS